MKRILMGLTLMPFMTLATTWYVNGTTGSDGNSGTSPDAAKKTIQSAIDVATDGSTIIVADGVYAAIAVKGFRRIVIKSANGAMKTIIDGNNATTVADLNSDKSQEWSTIRANQLIGFTLQHGTSGAGGNGAMKDGIARNCLFRYNYGAGYSGASVSKGYSAFINCIAYENRYGTSWGGGVFANCLVVNCTLYNNSGYGLWDGNIYNTISYGNSQGDYRSSGCYNTFHNCLAARIWDSGLGNITGDPKFVDATNSDFSLAEDSPCIDAGSTKWYSELKYEDAVIPIEYFQTDFFGNQRVVGANVDIGAIEYGALQIESPIISPTSRTTFEESLTISMSSTTKGATIHYTTNGLTPTVESPTYARKFRIYGRTVVKAIAVAENGTTSEVAVAEYAKWRDDPVIRPKDGTVFEHSAQRVSITRRVKDGVVRYTTDGSEPTAESAVYVGSFTIDDTTTVKAKVFGDQCFDSDVLTATLTRAWVPAATPVITSEAQFTGSKQKVVLSCATAGAAIYYTTDGSEPTPQSARYGKPFYVTDSATVKAYAVMDDYLDSDVATLEIAKAWGIGDTLGKPDHKFATDGDAGFVRVDDATATLGESMRSGTIGNNQESILSTTVVGPGTLTFKWKVSCEQDEELHEWDHAEFAVDGVVVKVLDGETDWIEVSKRIVGDGEHTVTWTYVKDDVEASGEDCLWVSDYGWATDLTETQTTDVPVPYEWLRAKSRDAVDEYGIYERVAKQAAYNPRYTVEQCYVAGLDPESTTNEFRVLLGPDGEGGFDVSWNPNLKAERTYKIWGCETIEGGGDWHWPANALDRFFKVTVEMP